MDITIKNEIYSFIKNKFGISEPIIQKYLYDELPNIKPITIRQTLRRLAKSGEIIKSDHIQGVYFFPSSGRVLNVHSMNFNRFIDEKFLKNSDDDVIGYETGFTIANRLGLTTQNPSVTNIFSNAVGDRKREIVIDNRRFIINSPKFEVTTKNYRLLQILDIISNFSKYSEYPISEVISTFKHYLSDLTLTREEIDEILKHYPIKTQLNYYKMEVDHVITSR